HLHTHLSRDLVTLPTSVCSHCSLMTIVEEESSLTTIEEGNDESISILHLLEKGVIDFDFALNQYFGVFDDWKEGEIF
ncbi:hypothetical protein PMAYCL1PPCAC_07701, partial [Pristionchus mayeri]